MTSHSLSDLQLSIMQVLWAQGPATVSEVHRAVGVSKPLAPTTVATLLKRLEARGLLSHDQSGRQFIYRAQVSEQEVRKSMVGRLADRVFRGDVTELVCHLLSAKELDPQEVARVRAMLDSLPDLDQEEEA